MKKNKLSVQMLAAIGVMSALVFITTKFLRIPIPVGVGGKTQIHLGNSMCLLAGLLFGGVPGGLAAGIGTAIVDLMDPLWAPEFWISFINKFIMGFLAGTIATMGKERKLSKNIVAAIVGALSYVVLYLAKSYIQQKALGSAAEAIKAVLITKGITSMINAVIAVLISVLLYHMIAPVMKRQNLFTNETRD